MTSNENEGQQEQLQALKYQVFELRTALQNLAAANAIENVLAQGFEGLPALLAPLRDLTPRRTLMNDVELARLQKLLDALKRPDWSNASSLPVETKPVPFIGEVVPKA